MYYDNPNPFGKDAYQTLMIKDARKAFSRFHLGILAYIVSAYAVSMVIEVLLFLFLGDSYDTLAGNIYYQWTMGVLPMYVIGLPLLYLSVRSMPTKRLEKSRLSLSEFLIIFAISQTLMTVGNTIGNTLNGIFGAIKGEEISNSTAELIESSPIWLILAVAVIIGPIIEEFIFRKLMLDRLARYGNGAAIFISGLSFGLFHGNFYQFFYSALLGMLLAFVTVKTGNWLYSVVFHILINFFGSVAAIPFMNMAEELTDGLEAIEAGASVNASALINSALALMSYVVIQYGIIIAGAVFITLAIKHKWYSTKSCAEVNIPKSYVPSTVIVNLGMMLFLAVSFILFALSVALG